MKTTLALIALAFVLASCGGPRSYQVEAHAGAGMSNPTIGPLGMAAAPTQSSAASMAQSEASKSQAFWK